LEEFCEKHYEKLLPIMADKYEHERRKKEKLEEIKARLDFGEVRKRTTKAQESAYSESRMMSPRGHKRSHSPRQNSTVFTRLKRERSSHHESSRYSEKHSESEDSGGGHWKSKSRKQKSSVEDDDLSQPWVCAETDPFTSRIRHFDFPKTRMPSHVKTYDGTEDPEDHLKIFQAAAKTERWAMPTWCHMFNSTLTGNARVWFDDLPPGSIDSYNDLREAFLKNYLQQKKCIGDPIVLHNIKQRDGESTEDFMKRYKSESGNVKGAPECMRISGFVHGITNLELIKKFHEKIPKIIDEMMQVATSFLQGQAVASNQKRKKALPSWKHQEGSHRQNFKKGGSFRSQHKQEKRPDKFTLLTKTPREILALEKGVLKQNNMGKDLQKKERRATRKRKTSGNLNDSAVAKADDEHSTSTWMDFMVVRSTSPYNGIIGRPGLRKMKAVPSTTHGNVYVPRYGSGGTLTLRSSKIIPIECVTVSGPEDQPLPVNKVEEERIKVAINPEHTEQTVMIGSNLTEKARAKLYAVLSLQSPKCLKDVQKLNGKLASLNRFLAKSAEKSLPFFKTLKKCTKKSDFLRTEEAESTFKQMKELIAKLPMLIAPKEKEELIIYLAASKEAVSAVLMTEREAKQMPIYFVSRALRGPEVNYTSWKKCARH
ncbi:reverse transcriptase domain-containing protein, partial [Tanacetum coccineum]